MEITNVVAGANGFTNGTNNDIVGEQANLLLATSLADNGGDTLTLALSSGSVAINTIPQSAGGDYNGCPDYDQRVHVRPEGSGTSDNRDMGAYEYGAPLLVDLVSFEARGLSDFVRISWETASELENAGFHLWRNITQDGTYTRITHSLIPAEGSATSGATYTYTDREVAAPQVYYYKLEEIDTAGSRIEHGPVFATVGEVKLKTVTGSGIIDDANTADGMGEITLEGTGTHTVTTGKYTEQPPGTSAISGASGWWKVDVTHPADLISLTLSFCPAGSMDMVYFWDGKKWQPCSRQAYENNCLKVTVTESTQPQISDMRQLVFALADENSQIPALTQWGLIVLLMLLAAIGGLYIRRSKTKTY